MYPVTDSKFHKGKIWVQFIFLSTAYPPPFAFFFYNEDAEDVVCSIDFCIARTSGARTVCAFNHIMEWMDEWVNVFLSLQIMFFETKTGFKQNLYLA